MCSEQDITVARPTVVYINKKVVYVRCLDVSKVLYKGNFSMFLKQLFEIYMGNNIKLCISTNIMKMVTTIYQHFGIVNNNIAIFQYF